MRFAALLAVLAACSAEIVPVAPLQTLDDAAQAATLIELADADGSRFAIEVPAGVDSLTVDLAGGAEDTFFTASIDGIERCTSDVRCSMDDVAGTVIVDVHGTLAGTLSWTAAVDLGEAPTPNAPDTTPSAPSPEAPEAPETTVPDTDPLVCDYTAADMPTVTDVCVTEYVSCGDTVEGTVAGDRTSSTTPTGPTTRPSVA